MEQHYHSYPCTPFASSRHFPQGKTRNLEGPSFCRLTVVGDSAARGSENHKTGPAARRKCTPSAYGTSPRESVSRDFQVAVLPYKSRSLATPEGEVCSPLSF